MSVASPASSSRAPRPLTLISAGGRDNSLVLNVVIGAAALLIIGSAIIHLHLWASGYRHIPTIGWLFLLQGISALALGGAVGAVRRLWALVPAFLFVSSTIGGFLLSVLVGLFGFRDSWSAPYAGMAFALEVAALVLLTAGAASIVRASSRAVAGSSR